MKRIRRIEEWREYEELKNEEKMKD